MTATQLLVRYLKGQLVDRSEQLELWQEQHKLASHKPNCKCQTMIDKERADIQRDCKALDEIAVALQAEMCTGEQDHLPNPNEQAGAAS